jgi:hypothetical protein
MHPKKEARWWENRAQFLRTVHPKYASKMMFTTKSAEQRWENRAQFLRTVKRIDAYDMVFTLTTSRAKKHLHPQKKKQVNPEKK